MTEEQKSTEITSNDQVKVEPAPPAIAQPTRDAAIALRDFFQWRGLIGKEVTSVSFVEAERRITVACVAKKSPIRMKEFMEAYDRSKLPLMQPWAGMSVSFVHGGRRRISTAPRRAR